MAQQDVSIEWNIEPGQRIKRTDLHNRFGGAGRGGMEPSGKTPNVLLFTEPSAGERFGYKFDGWHTDGTFHYTGEGQKGDQVVSFGNRAVADHVAQNRSLRLFEANGPFVTYVGEFELPQIEPYFFEEAPDREGRPRKVIVFRLAPLSQIEESSKAHVVPEKTQTKMPVEQASVDDYIARRPFEDPVAVRREAQLVTRYSKWLASMNVPTSRHRIPTRGGTWLYTDLYNEKTKELIEAKGSASRMYIRLGLGQILDYARLVKHSRKSLLLPTQPSEDLIELLHQYDVGCIWEAGSGSGFQRLDPPA